MFLAGGPAVDRAVDLLPADLIARLERRRGRAYAFEHVEPAATALVVVDMTNLHVGDDPKPLAAADRINIAAQAVRAGGGRVLWVRPAPTTDPDLAARILGDEHAARYRAAALDEGGRNALHPSLAAEPGDLHARKTGYSAFFPGQCDAAAQLRECGVDTVLIAGIVANVCCEASARDAHSCGFRTILLADAVVGSSERACLASFAAIHRNFGDVRLVGEVLEMLAASD